MGNNKFVFLKGKKIRVGQINHWAFDESVNLRGKIPSMKNGGKTFRHCSLHGRRGMRLF